MPRTYKKWKTCKECRIPKPVKEFYKTASGAARSKCKQCVRNYNNARYLARKEQSQYKERSPNRERQQKIEAHRERASKWKKRHPVEYAKQQEAAEQREKTRGYPSASKRRALEFDAFEEDVNKRTLYDLYNGECGICGGDMKYQEMTIDHIIPLSKDGKHSYANCQPAHAVCNRRKGNTMP